MESLQSATCNTPAKKHALQYTSNLLLVLYHVSCCSQHRWQNRTLGWCKGARAVKARRPGSKAPTPGGLAQNAAANECGPLYAAFRDLQLPHAAAYCITEFLLTTRFAPAPVLGNGATEAARRSVVAAQHPPECLLRKARLGSEVG